MARRSLFAITILFALLLPQLAFGHAERPTPSPARPGGVPDQNRVHPVVIDVCKTGECTYEHIQAAVLSVPFGNETNTLIRIWPGFYREEDSRAKPILPPDNSNGTYSFQHHVDHPNSQNLIAIVGRKNITLRGMGVKPRDVVIDVGFRKHVGIRGDRADGIIIENISVWHAFDHGVYILDTGGFVIDRVHSGYAREYPFLTFANDHGLMKNCEAFGGGDGGIYPGSSADTPGRVSTEISHCKSYHNVLGYSGTQGDHVWVHDSEFYDNAVGLVTDSETDHPNYPQNNLILERNRFYNNNFNVYSKDSDVRATVFANSILIPVGVGVLIAGGNDNLVQNNDIYGNARYGLWLLNGTGLLLGPGAPVVDGGPFAPPFISEGNQFVKNTMYNTAAPAGSQNGIDFAWDGLGLSNCWQDNARTPQGDAATSDGLMLPPCNNPIDGSRLPVTPGIPNPQNLAIQAGLLFVDSDGDGQNDRPVCDFVGTCGVEWTEGPPPEKARNFPEGYQLPPTPPTCGPSTCPATAAGTTPATPSVGSKPAPLPAPGTLPSTGLNGAPFALVMLLLMGAATGVRVLRRRA